MFQLNLWNRGAFDELVKDTYNSDMGYPGKARGSQTTEERHITFSNLALKVRLWEVLRFVCDIEKGVVSQPDKFAGDRTGKINETVA